MKYHILWIVGFALCMTGCAEKEQAAPEQDDTLEMATPVAEPAVSFDEAFIQHMHAHAEKLDDLNFSLSDGELEKAKLSAYWLSRHETVGGVPADWQPYIVGMREAARAVEDAPDIMAARAAAERISQQCQSCHVAAGI
jgi:hypothetical protein